jgi:hypothetical protein
VARQIEDRAPSFENLLVTAQEALSGRRLHPAVKRALLTQAAARFERVDWRWSWNDLLHVGLAVTVVAAAVVIGLAGPTAADSDAPSAADPGAVSAARATLRVTVIPPAYARLPTTSHENPTRVEVLEASAVLLRVEGATGPLELTEPGGAAEPFRVADGVSTTSVIASTSRVLLVRDIHDPRNDRILQLDVRRDERPSVVIEQPGRDLIMPTASGQVAIAVSARDDLAVASLSVRYTRISGGGETFTFEEGELPVDVTGHGSNSLTGRATLLLDRLKLEDGDTLVYRAVARDEKPASDLATSESFLVEIGKRTEALGGGFAVPDDRDRQALSQQMLIVKTERLHSSRRTLSADAILEQSRLLAVEQRMVRAEFVFMTGGEVVDEIEEAEHAHDLAEGRLENQGQVELLNAMREMSRAEARLNSADTAQALIFERAALAALQKAFDRRRYFLRTLPERTRIDPSRRFAGDVSSARPRRPDAAMNTRNDNVDRLRQTLRELSDAITVRSVTPRLAAKVLAADASAAALQKFAVAVASGPSSDTTVAAAEDAARYLAALLRQQLAAAAPGRLQRDPLRGALAERLRRGVPP